MFFLTHSRPGSRYTGVMPPIYGTLISKATPSLVAVTRLLLSSEHATTLSRGVPRVASDGRYIETTAFTTEAEQVPRLPSMRQLNRLERTLLSQTISFRVDLHFTK